MTDWLTPAVAILFNPDALFASLNFTVRGSIFPYGAHAWETGAGRDFGGPALGSHNMQYRP